MDLEVKKKWINALRSGDYEQGRNRLCSDEGFCCLGVLCDISGLGKWESAGDGAKAYVTPYDDYRQLYSLPASVRNWAGFETILMFPEVFVDGERRMLSTLNDEGRTFEQIAQLIEENL